MTRWTSTGPADRSVIALLLSLALLGGALGLLQHRTSSALRPASRGPAAATRPVVDRQLRLDQCQVHPPVIAVPQGARLRLTLINAGHVEHAIAFEGYDIQGAALPPGSRVQLILNADQAGRFPLTCRRLGHDERSMGGVLIVHPLPSLR